MRRSIALVLVALGLVVPATAAAPPPARVQVAADEFSLSLSRPAIKSGFAIVQLANFGEDPHDLRLRRAGGTRTYSLEIVRPGAVTNLETKLLPGKFTLWCSLGDHRRRGMQTVLVVRP